MIKLLYIVHRIELNCHQYIIDNLRANDIKVDVETVGPAPRETPGINVWKTLQDDTYLTKLYKNNYNFVISCTHSEYLKKLRLRLVHSNFIDMEHDLFSSAPTHFNESTVFTFQKKHTDYCRSKGIPFVECTFPKFSAPYKKVNLGVDKFNEVLIIGTAAFNERIKSGTPVDKRGFNKVWYKKYSKEWAILKGTTELPNDFNGPLGILNCVDNFNFLLTVSSSSFVEFILLGKVPILISSENKNYGSVFDKINASDIQNKVKELRADPELFKQTNKSMLAHWAGPNYSKLPSASEALLNYIKEHK